MLTDKAVAAEYEQRRKARDVAEAEAKRLAGLEVRSTVEESREIEVYRVANPIFATRTTSHQPHHGGFFGFVGDLITPRNRVESTETHQCGSKTTVTRQRQKRKKITLVNGTVTCEEWINDGPSWATEE